MKFRKLVIKMIHNSNKIKMILVIFYNLNYYLKVYKTYEITLEKKPFLNFGKFILKEDENQIIL